MDYGRTIHNGYSTLNQPCLTPEEWEIQNLIEHYIDNSLEEINEKYGKEVWVDWTWTYTDK